MKSTLARECRLEPGRIVVVGISGGPDSLCLLDLLWRSGYPLVVAHLDHGLREESAAEAQAVAGHAGRLGLPFRMSQENVSTHAKSEGLSIEEAAREVRYRFLFNLAEQEGAQSVAVGHNADDQVETVLMHLLRGAGLAGLRGMAYYSLPNAWSTTIPLVRPLLGIWREDILAYIEERELQAAFDASNLDTRFYRNRLRHNLLPHLESYNPGFRKRLWRMALTLGDDYSTLAELTRSAWAGCLLDDGPGYLRFNLDCLAGQPVSIQRHLFRRAILHLRPDLRDLDFDAIQRCLDFLGTPPATRQSDLIAGLRLRREADYLWLATWETDLPGGAWPQLAPGSRLMLPAPGRLELPGGWQLEAETIHDPQAALASAQTNRDPYQAWLDAERLEFPLIVRTRQKGDRFSPLGMGGHSTKLADFMVNHKLPQRGRANWPLVCTGEQIAWVPGLRLAEPYRLSQATVRAVRLALQPARR